MPLAQRSVIMFACVTAVFGCSEKLTPQIVDPVYEEACQYTDCSGSGECVVGDAGAPLCLCDVGYQNESCSRCEVGFHRDALNRCVPDRRCADQATDPCGPAGFCRDSDSVITCDCEEGYAGPRCNVCTPGYLRDPQLGCVLTACPWDAGNPSLRDASQITDAGSSRDASAPECNPGNTQMMDFAPQTGWPSESNTCFSSPTLSITGTSLRSQQGDVPVYLCADSTINGLATRHVELTAAPSRAAEIQWRDPVASLSFEYASRLQPLSLSVLADGVPVATIDLEARSHASMMLTLDPPARTIGFLSRTLYSQAIGFDNIFTRTGECL